VTTRKAVLVLANYTGWSLSELLDLSLEELMEWVTALPKGK
jgi:hypothetical protein